MLGMVLSMSAGVPQAPRKASSAWRIVFAGVGMLGVLGSGVGQFQSIWVSWFGVPKFSP